MTDEWQEAVAHRLHDEARRERGAGPDAVDDRTRRDAGDELRRRRDRDSEPGGSQPEAADVVEVDDEERQHDAVPERVDDAADLEEPDVARQLRIEAAEQPHSATVSARQWRTSTAGLRAEPGRSVPWMSMGEPPTHKATERV